MKNPPKRPRGRPATGIIQDRVLQMRVSSSFLKSIDEWRHQQDNTPSRTEAIRRLVEQALAAKPKR